MKKGLETPARAIFLRVAALLSVLCSATVAADSNGLYDTYCAMCHQRGGVGLKGQFPRLAGRAAEIGQSEAGRRFLIEVALFGMAGKIEVDGTPVVGVMPSFASLKDEDVASVLNYIIGLEGQGSPPKRTKPLEAADIAAVRSGEVLSASQVLANRAQVLAKAKKK
ncbi:MAG: cytochrome c [Steroidobacteraceae bacterium]